MRATALWLLLALAAPAMAADDSRVVIEPQPSRTDCYGFSDSAVQVIVKDGDPNGNVADHLCTASPPKTKVVTDTRHRDYVVVDFGRRTKRSIDEILKVYQLESGQIFEILETRISCISKSSARARFAYQIDTPAGGGLEFKLHGEAGLSLDSHISRDDFNCDRNRTLLIDTPRISDRASPSLQAFTATTQLMGALGDTLGERIPCEFDTDAMALLLANRGNSPNVWLFCSSYGKAHAEAVTDPTGGKYVILDYGEGHGSGLARTPYLAVYAFEDLGLRELLRIRTAWTSGPFQQFSYNHTSATVAGGLLLTLDGIADKNSLCCVPRDQNRAIVVSAPH